jgi:hypothetical protein
VFAVWCCVWEQTVQDAGIGVPFLAARRYPAEDFDQRADDLSVSHPEITQRYREARRIAQANKDGNADTEDLRQAVTSYRSLVLALLADDGDRSRHDGKPPHPQPRGTAVGVCTAASIGYGWLPARRKRCGVMSIERV